MSDNWIVQNLNSALQTWSDKLAEIWTLLTQSPENFKGGAIWSVMTNINGGLRAIGYGLLVLFFAAGLVKTCGSFTDMKKPEHVVKAFIRFALAQGAVMSGMELLTAIFSIVQGIVANIMSHSGMAGGTVTELPSEIVDKIEAVGMLESIPLWIVTLLGSLLTGNRMAVCAWGGSLCSLRFFPLPRHDGRTVRMDSHQIRTAVPETAGIQIGEPVLFLHGREPAAG